MRVSLYFLWFRLAHTVPVKKNILDIYLCDAKFQWGLYTDVGLIGGMSLAL